MARVILILLFVISSVLALSGCDRLIVRKATIDLDRTEPAAFGTTVQPKDLQQFFRQIEVVAIKNGLRCNAYRESDKYFGCGIGTFNLLTHVKGDQVVQVVLSQFGPLGKTRQFERLEKDVNEMLAREFPGRDLVLRQEE